MRNFSRIVGASLLLLWALPSLAQEAAAPTQPAAPAPAVAPAPTPAPAPAPAPEVAPAPVPAPAPAPAPAPVAEVAPAPAPAPADSGAFPAEFSATPDSAAAPVDSSAVPADSAAPAAAVVAPADTVKADTVKADTVKKDTVVVAKVDSSAVKADSSAAKQDSAFTPAEPTNQPASSKRMILGVFGAVTYNNLYDSKLGLANLDDDATNYTVKATGQDDLMGNYWGVGANLGLGILYMFTDILGIHAEFGASYRAGNGESDVTVTLTWDDEDRQRERAYVGIEYSLKQVNVDIPILFRAALQNVLYVEMGPMASFSFYSHEKSTVIDDKSKGVYRGDNVCNFFEFDMAFGLGAMRRIGTKSIEAGLRFVMGMTRLSDADDAPKTWQGQFNMTFWFL